MELNNIDKLIKKYLAGETTLNEEKDLKNYFLKTKETPDKYLKFKYLFGHLDEKSAEKSTLKLDDIITKEKPANKTRRIVIWAIAASIALLISVFALKNNQPEQKIYAYINGKPITDKEMAMAETQKALLLISNNLNEGTSNLNHLKDFNKAEEILRAN